MYQNVYGHGGNAGAFPPGMVPAGPQGGNQMLPNWMLLPPGLPGPILGQALPMGMAAMFPGAPPLPPLLLPGVGMGQTYGQARPTAMPSGLGLSQGLPYGQAQMPPYGVAPNQHSSHWSGPQQQAPHQQGPMGTARGGGAAAPGPAPGLNGGGNGAGGDRPRRRFTEAPPGVYDRGRSRYDNGPDRSRDRDRDRDADGVVERGRERERERSWDGSREQGRGDGRQSQGPQWNGNAGAAARDEGSGGAGRAPFLPPPPFVPDPGQTPGRGPDGGPPPPPAVVAAASRSAASAAGGGASTSGRGGGGDGATANGGYRSRSGHVYTVLDRNIRNLVSELTPSEAEVKAKEQVLQAVRQATAAAFPEAAGRLRVEPFGSYMCGLGTRSSDIDVVLVGLAEPSSSLGFYSKDERPRIARLLDRLNPCLRQRLRPTRLLCIRHARVPITKLTTQDGTCVDISIAGMNGPRAAAYIRQQVTAFPALRPLVLVLKSYLKAEGLSEVASGGLSSYGLTYMTMAHLMEESRRGSDPSDLGSLLHSLLRRFGRNFDCGLMAVSVRDGGLVPKSALGFGHVDHGDRIVTIDPLTGRNCTEGTYRSAEVLDAFTRADAYLTAWVARPDADVPHDADILGPLVSALPYDDDEDEPYTQAYAPPAGGAPLGKRGRSQELAGQTGG